MNKDFLVNNGIDVDKSLELFGDMDMYNETLVEFLNGVEKKLTDLKTAKESADSHNYGIYAHSLKSDARYLGFTTLAEIAYNHEMAGKNNDLNYIYDNYDVLVNETKRIVKIVSEYCGLKEDVIKEVKKEKSNKAILVVDDSQIVTSFINKIFNDTYEVYIAHDGESAIKHINDDVEHKIIGMFLDLNMPNVNGFQVLRYFDQNNLFEKVPVTIITGVDEKDEIKEVLNYPILGILSKPFNEKAINDSVLKMEGKK